MAHLTSNWAAWYANSAPVRTMVGFAHIGGLVASGGPALVMDRTVLRASHADEQTKSRAVFALSASHRWILAALGVVMISGMLLLAADLDTYLESRVFWIKMAGVLVLAINGAVIKRATPAAGPGHERAWRTLRVAACISIASWTLITLLGAALPNVG
jgi:Family of unknown function (DUF6644)